MGKLQKYDDCLLTEAVIQYEKVHEGKIKISELAKWASVNVEGLEGVQSYHFARPMQVKDKYSHKISTIEKKCTKRINETNAIRNISLSAKRNALLNSSKPDEFFNYPVPAQRKMISDARETFHEVRKENVQIRQLLEIEKRKNESLSVRCIESEKTVSELKKEIYDIKLKINHSMKKNDAKSAEKMLLEIGIGRNKVDLEKYMNSLSMELYKCQSEYDAIMNFLKLECDLNKEIEGTDCIEENFIGRLWEDKFEDIPETKTLMGGRENKNSK